MEKNPDINLKIEVEQILGIYGRSQCSQLFDDVSNLYKLLFHSLTTTYQPSQENLIELANAISNLAKNHKPLLDKVSRLSQKQKKSE